MSTASEASDMVLHERRGSVLTITINRPAQKNAVDHEVAVQLAATLDLLDADPEPSAGVLTGAGRVFSAGSVHRETDPRVAQPLIPATSTTSLPRSPGPTPRSNDQS
ncbi:enoyl-CoA hydratase-related protein [Streptomyces sp. NPDC058231]|uniref:enoyl-CoA hydratase-related protein n=1 Tax=Streptomyces sp. NPDC058231 TaxID=3346392 RepID=UPI0036E9ED71